MFLSWYKRIDKNRFQIDLLIRTQDKNAPALLEYKRINGNYYRLASLHNPRLFKKSTKDFFQKHHDYDILHAHGTDPWVFYYARKFGIKNIIVHSHYANVSSLTKERIKFIVSQYLINKYADYGLACSKKAAHFLFHDDKFKNKKINIVNNAIDSDKFVYNSFLREQQRKYMSLENKFVVGHVGRLTYQKNQFFLFDIFKEIVKQRDNAVLLLIGDGPDAECLQNYSKKLNINNKVIFMGAKNNIASLFRVMDCFILPSRWEGLPVTVVEALASGLPCFISDEITREVNLINNLVFYHSILENPKNWADDILCKTETVNRVNTQKIINSKGFDIKSAVIELENIYTSILKD